jgi:hypothetical protein
VFVSEGSERVKTATLSFKLNQTSLGKTLVTINRHSRGRRLDCGCYWCTSPHSDIERQVPPVRAHLKQSTQAGWAIPDITTRPVRIPAPWLTQWLRVHMRTRCLCLCLCLCLCVCLCLCLCLSSESLSLLLARNLRGAGPLFFNTSRLGPSGPTPPVAYVVGLGPTDVWRDRVYQYWGPLSRPQGPLPLVHPQGPTAIGPEWGGEGRGTDSGMGIMLERVEGEGTLRTKP